MANHLIEIMDEHDDQIVKWLENNAASSAAVIESIWQK